MSTSLICIIQDDLRILFKKLNLKAFRKLFESFRAFIKNWAFLYEKIYETQHVIILLRKDFRNLELWNEIEMKIFCT